jgi:uncharacterized protein with HEPN domain
MGTTAGGSRNRAARRLAGLRPDSSRWERGSRTRDGEPSEEADARARPADAARRQGRTERDRLLLLRMIESINRMNAYLENGRVEFMESTMVQDAVVWNLKLVCHCAKRISDVEKARHPEVDWTSLAALFRTLVRNPWQLDPEEVWDCVGEELPPLRRSVQAILSQD